MPIPVRKASVEDEIVPRNLSSRRVNALREGPTSPNFVPRRTSPLTTRPFSYAMDDDFELSPHVPVPMDPERGITTVPEKPRRTPRSPYGMLETGSGYFSNSPYESESESRRRKASMSGATSLDGSHENSNSTASHSSQGLNEKFGMTRQRSTSMDSGSPPIFPVPLLKPRPPLHRPSSFADLRNRASMIMSGSRSSSNSSLHLPHSVKKDKSSSNQVVLSDDPVDGEDPKRRRRSIAKFVLDVFRPKSRRTQSLSIDVTKTTSVTKVEQTSFRRYE